MDYGFFVEIAATAKQVHSSFSFELFAIISVCYALNECKILLLCFMLKSVEIEITKVKLEAKDGDRMFRKF